MGLIFKGTYADNNNINNEVDDNNDNIICISCLVSLACKAGVESNYLQSLGNCTTCALASLSPPDMHLGAFRIPATM